ncbi:glycosyltransferase family 9 protein [Mycobacterium sp. 1274756.6]|uniref:glycosyltransferase family 9 protein n=1 Tax=Mycobacterium sp. 1274756.6 TaxID=1834076 RepID=UPI000B042B79|nr:glycosyltransferase family 9 protein [Mycobacterium sp. 1274756.6]
MAVTAPPQAPTAAPATILALRAIGLGDLLTGIPALRALRRAYPHAHLVLATPDWLAGLACLSGAVDEVLPTAALGALRWPHPPPQLAVNLHGRGPQSITDLLTTHPDAVITHRHPDFPQLGGPAWRDEQHEVDRWCGLLGAAGITADPQDLALDRPAGHPRHDGVIVIHPGAAAPSRRWPADRFAAVAAELAAAGHRVVVTGSRAERPLAEHVAAQAGLDAAAVLAGQLDVLGMVALISDAQLLVCGDTGVGHIATATGTASVLVFGPTPPSHWGPRGAGHHITVWAGDRGDPHAEQPDPGLLLITAARVLDAAADILGRCA